MCWIGIVDDNSSVDKFKKVANEDIQVYKIVTHDDHSYYADFPYKSGEKYSEHIIPVQECYYSEYLNLRIGKGLHCYNPKFNHIKTDEDFLCVIEVVDNNNSPISIYGYRDIVYRYGEVVNLAESVKQVFCVIPKGTTYYENSNGEIVTECLIYDKLI